MKEKKTVKQHLKEKWWVGVVALIVNTTGIGTYSQFSQKTINSDKVQKIEQLLLIALEKQEKQQNEIDSLKRGKANAAYVNLQYSGLSAQLETQTGLITEIRTYILNKK